MSAETGFYSEEEAIAAVGRLDHALLARFVRTRVILPADSEAGSVYRGVDLARMELLCDLCCDFDLGDEALDMVMRLVDQLHGARGDLKALMRALGEEPEEVRLRVLGRLG
ncbi:hypothetical protein KM176_06985 [Pseudooceanicola sp. CBS1P-1]|uniref:Chaperone modulatory protein CbpM n=1 Tax=Pseudooceanicola albus TaxID=2692189 RepID=A0A6L7G041_9RHOB|nr:MULTISPECIES: hypothetical protein [Pseudooceanicola]MBT9383596.1 hypothetical protein [Pseudooceanicola endophyticus]MXN17451.1 hypothetical protein [Pseudooceanicola albus]